MNIKVSYVLRYKEDYKYCITKHIEISEEDIFEYVKQFRKPSKELYISDENFEIEGINI